MGARNLQECLLIQLAARGLEDSLATRIIRDHFDDFKQKKYPELAKKLRVSIQEIQASAR